MSIYKRSGSDTYSYDFRKGKVRYSGDTGTSDRTEAEAHERLVKDEAMVANQFCRALLRRAQRNPVASPKRPIGHVYMIRTGYFVKIGYSSDPAERLRSVSTATPEACELVFCVRGDMNMERRMHAEFAACHYRREWFFLCGKLKAFLAEFESSSDMAKMQALRRRGSANSHAMPGAERQPIVIAAE